MKKIKALNAVLGTLLLTLGVATVNHSVSSKVVNAEDETVTLDFGSHSDFATWNTSYLERTMNFDVATVKFEGANKQGAGQTITDCPVTKGKSVEVIAKPNYVFKSVIFTCKQWGAKAQTITLSHSTDYSESYSATGSTSSNFVLKNDSLPADTNALKFTFDTTNQVGIVSCELTYEYVGGQLEILETPLVDNVVVSNGADGLSYTSSLVYASDGNEASNTLYLFDSNDEQVYTQENYVSEAPITYYKPGTYTAKIQSVGDGLTYGDSELSDATEPFTLTAISATVDELLAVFGKSNASDYMKTYYYRVTSNVGAKVAGYVQTSSFEGTTGTLTIYGLNDLETGKALDWDANGLYEGDKLTIVGQLDLYKDKQGNETKEMVNSYYVSHVANYSNAFVALETKGSLSYDWSKVETGTETTADSWKLVTDAAELNAGDQIVIGEQSSGAVAGNIAGKYLSYVAATFGENVINSLPDDACVFTLDGDTGAWKLQMSDGNTLGLSGTGNNNITTNKNNSWSIGFSGTNAIISNNMSTSGSIFIRCNSTSGQERFSNYGSNSTAKVPQIYKFVPGSVVTTYDYSISNVRLQFGATITKDLYTKLGASEIGVVLAKSEDSLKDATATDRRVYNLTDKLASVDVEDGTATEVVDDGDYYQFGVNVLVPAANYAEVVYAAVYAVVDGKTVYMTSKSYSVATAAATYKATGNYNADANLYATLSELASAK